MKIDKELFTYSSDGIHKLESIDQWKVYWMQQNFMNDIIRIDDEILEVGVGSGFCSKYLKNRGYSVTTLDIDENKNPDIVGNIVYYELTMDFDYILAYEVLEHIPFKYLKNTLRKLRTKCRKGLFISIPEYYPVIFSLKLKIPKMKLIEYSFLLPHFFTYKKKLSTHHHWEVNSTHETRLENIIELFSECEFSIVKVVFFEKKYLFMYFKII
jgi:cyclopropane fatty-acyl-phospholipid synthase-like methyltransferase